MEKKKTTVDREANKTVSKQLLESYRKSLYKVKEFFDTISDRDFDPDNVDESMKIIKSILDAGDKLGKNIETLAVLEKKVENEELERSRVRGNAKISMLEDGQL
jgi:hypothetical protein